VESKRLPLLDAIRGLCILGVVMGHSYGFSFIHERYDAAGLKPLAEILTYGLAIRVPLLFWLSGLVNMLVIDKYISTNGNTLGFLARRFIRLSPTWWLSIAFVMLVGCGAALRKGLPLPIPSAVELICNLLYIPRVAGSDVIGGVAWTLCIEFQLYLLFAMTIAAIHKMTRDRRIRDLSMAIWIIASSVICFYIAPNVIRTTWFVQHWPWFGLGIMSCLTIRRRIPQWMTLIMVAILAIGQVRLDAIPFAVIQWFGLLMITILSYQALDANVWQHGRALKWLGDISYAYFLFHMQFNLHAHYLAGITDRLGLPIITVYIATILLPLLLAVAITPLMNRIDKVLMARLFR
jgi:peptidoglycan/LPS O-acetylase OafA/YrhL